MIPSPTAFNAVPTTTHDHDQNHDHDHRMLNGHENGNDSESSMGSVVAMCKELTATVLVF
jgi:hypothetical protein